MGLMILLEGIERSYLDRADFLVIFSPVELNSW